MCLITNNPEISIAEKDIVCYKKLRSFDDMLISPFYMHFWEIGETYKLRYSLETKVIEFDSIFANEGDYIVRNGFHATQTICALIGYCTGEAYKVIIPKGSQYVKGYGREIVSNQMTLVRKLSWVEVRFAPFIDLFNSFKK